MYKQIFLAVLAFSAVQAWDWDVETPLDTYVNHDDGYFNYELMETHDQGDHMVYILNVTSQKWKDETLTTAPVWWHHLAILVPTEANWPDSAFLFVGSGNLNSNPPVPGVGRMAQLADFVRNTGAVAAYLHNVPNQPVIFHADPRPRSEDAIIAFTWKLILNGTEEGGEPERDLNLLFPMTKAGKRALDVIEQFVPTVHPGIAPTQFMVTGYSKRGWVTWLLACVDQRVIAIAPTVFDLPGFYENLHHHNRAMGGWSWAFSPYWNEDVARYLNHPLTLELGKDIDPIEYNERLTMPKMVIIGGNDQFFPPSGSHYFFDDLTPPKFMCLWENDDHGLGAHQDQIDRNLEVFFIATKMGYRLPSISFTREATDEGGSITVWGDSPLSLTAWVLDTTNKTCEPLRNNTCRRDTRFRALNGLTDNWWVETPVEDLGGIYQVELERRQDDRYRAFFIEMIYPGPEGLVFRFSTEVNIIPDTFPYPRCVTEEECHGRLV